MNSELATCGLVERLGSDEAPAKCEGQDNLYNFVSSPVAESLLIHRVEPEMPSSKVAGARIPSAVTHRVQNHQRWKGASRNGRIRSTIAASNGSRRRHEVDVQAVCS